jgi:hypothetical protein
LQNPRSQIVAQRSGHCSPPLRRTLNLTRRQSSLHIRFIDRWTRSSTLRRLASRCETCPKERFEVNLTRLDFVEKSGDDAPRLGTDCSGSGRCGAGFGELLQKVMIGKLGTRRAIEVLF